MEVVCPHFQIYAVANEKEKINSPLMKAPETIVYLGKNNISEYLIKCVERRK